MAMRKSQVTGVLLTLFFGPIGLLYSSIAAGVSLILVAIGVGVLTAGIGAIVLWLCSIPVGVYTVSRHNQSIAVAATRQRALPRTDDNGRESG